MTLEKRDSLNRKKESQQGELENCFKKKGKKYQENEVFHCFHLFSIYLPWSDGARCHDLSFLDAEF